MRSYLLGGGASGRWNPKPQLALPPFDSDDEGGQVHTTLPSEFTASWKPTASLMQMRADFNGVVVDMARWKLTPADFEGVVGQNTTPINQLMSPMLPAFKPRVIDAYVQEYLERYTHFVYAPSPWEQHRVGVNWTPQQMVTWARQLRSFGIPYLVLWNGDPVTDDPFLLAGLEAGVVDMYVNGKEVDGKMRSEDYLALTRNVMSRVSRVPVLAHFTATYPIHAPRDTFFDGANGGDWAEFDGRLHLAQQVNQDDTAGAQSALNYFARKWVNLGVGPDGQRVGPGAPSSHIYLFEVEASAQLYGYCGIGRRAPEGVTMPDYLDHYGGNIANPDSFGLCQEAYGCLRSWEGLCATRLDPAILPVGGYGNGCRRPDGNYL